MQYLLSVCVSIQLIFYIDKIILSKCNILMHIEHILNILLSLQRLSHLIFIINLKVATVLTNLETGFVLPVNL